MSILALNGCMAMTVISGVIGSVDSSCNDAFSCFGADIGSVVSSCTRGASCRDAQIGSVDSSCRDPVSSIMFPSSIR